ncbi:MAG: DinB family protein [Candidatus Rokuibacteriota bacterium]
MGARADQLAGKFEQSCREINMLVERLSDAEWKKVTAGEQWPVGVAAHHVAEGHAGIASIIQAIAKGQPMPTFTMDMLHEMNAKHAKEHANTTKVATLELLQTNGAKAAAAVRALSDVDLDRSGTVLAGMPAMSVAQVIEGILINHVNEHMGSIRTALGAT